MKITLTGTRRADDTTITLMENEVVTTGVTIDFLHEKAVEAFGSFLYCINISADDGSFICGAIDEGAVESLSEEDDDLDLFDESDDYPDEDSWLFYDDEGDIYAGTYSEM